MTNSGDIVQVIDWERRKKTLVILCVSLMVFPAMLSFIQGRAMMLFACMPVVAVLYFRGMSRINFAINNGLTLPDNPTFSDLIKLNSQFYGSSIVNLGLVVLATLSSAVVVVLYAVF